MKKLRFGNILISVLMLFPLYSSAQSVLNTTVAAVANPAPIATTAPVHPPYVIGDDDLLAINVWDEKALSMTVPVRSDGNISLPLVGQMLAAGRTPLQLQDMIQDHLRKYVTNPQVTVIVMAMNSQRVNVLGRVVKPGSYPLLHATTVLDAIATAGGFQDFAKKRSVYVLRTTPGGRERRIAFNYKDVIRGKHPEENIRLQPNDTVVVP